MDLSGSPPVAAIEQTRDEIAGPGTCASWSLAGLSAAPPSSFRHGPAHSSSAESAAPRASQILLKCAPSSGRRYRAPILQIRANRRFGNIGDIAEQTWTRNVSRQKRFQTKS